MEPIYLPSRFQVARVPEAFEARAVRVASFVATFDASDGFPPFYEDASAVLSFPPANPIYEAYARASYRIGEDGR